MVKRRGETEFYLALGYDIENGIDVRVLVRDEGYAKYVQPASVCGIPKKEGVTVLPTIELPNKWLYKWRYTTSDESISNEHDAWLRVA